MTQTLNNLIVCGSTPLEASMTMTAQSAAISVRYVSSEKSSCPGVSRILIHFPSYSNCNTEEVTEIPLSFSISIQSDTACLEFAFPLTDPAVLIAPPYKRNFSVSVVLPASGWEMIAKVLLRPISCSMLFAIIFFLFSILSIYHFTFLRILSHIITPMFKFLLILMKKSTFLLFFCKKNISLFHNCFMI